MCVCVHACVFASLTWYLQVDDHEYRCLEAGGSTESGKVVMKTRKARRKNTTSSVSGHSVADDIMYDVPESAASTPAGPDRYTFLGGSGHVRSQSSASLQDHPQTYSRLSYAEDAPIATVEEVEDNGDIYVRACPSH